MPKFSVDYDHGKWNITCNTSSDRLFLKIQPLKTTKNVTANIQLTSVPDDDKRFGVIDLQRTINNDKDTYCVIRLDAYTDLIADGCLLNIAISEANSSAALSEITLFPINSRQLKVEGKTIPVSREMLSILSPGYFRVLFYNENGRNFKEAGQEVIEIKEQSYENMRYLFDSLQEFRHYPLSDAKACLLYQLCKYFDLQALLDRSKQVLLKSKLGEAEETKPLVLNIADLYEDEELLAHLQTTLGDLSHIFECIKQCTKQQLSQAVIVKLLEKPLQLKEVEKREQEKPECVYLQFSTGRVVVQLDWIDCPLACEDFLQVIRRKDEQGRHVTLKYTGLSENGHLISTSMPSTYDWTDKKKKVKKSTVKWALQLNSLKYYWFVCGDNDRIIGDVIEGDDVLNARTGLTLVDYGIVHCQYISTNVSSR